MLKICGLPSQRIRFFSRLSIRKHKFSLTYTNFSAFSFLIKKNNDKIESRKDPVRNSFINNQIDDNYNSKIFL